MAIDLAVDVGGSGIRVAAVRGGRVVAERQWTFSSPLLRPALTAADYLTSAPVREWLAEPVDRVVMGLSGLFGEAGQAEHDTACERLHVALGIRSLAICDDSVTAFFGALGLEPGVVSAVGTGIVTVGWAGPRAGDRDGVVFHRVDGWGAVGGDLGSGYWIAQRGIRAALEMIDGRRSRSALRDIFLLRYGTAADFSRVTVFGQPTKAYVADFAQDVLELAGSGDATAKQIVDSAAAEIIRAISSASERAGLPTPTICLTGNVVSPGGPLESRVQDHYAAAGGQGRWRARVGSPLEGAVRLLEAPELIQRLASSEVSPNPVQLLGTQFGAQSIAVRTA